MIKAKSATLLFAALFAAALSTQASASVVYDLTFENGAGTVDEGTGVFTLNYSTIAQVENLSANLSATNFISLVTTNINSNGAFTVTPSNLAYGSFSTSPTGTFYSLTVAETVPSCDYSGTCDILIVDLYTNTWQIHDEYNSTLNSGEFTVAGPTLSSTPLPATLPLFAGGLGFVGYLTRRRKHAAK